jgi:Helix-turn-helix domain
MSLAVIAGAVARAHLKPRREKLFGEGRAIPLDRNGKARVAAYARALSHRTEKGKHYGELTDKFLTVLRVLLWQFHNAGNGRCFPSYESIAAAAHCGRTTVYQAIHALERAGIMGWVHRLTRVREWGPDLFGRGRNRWRVIRTSNAYTFIDPQPPARPPDPSKFKFGTGTPNQDLNLLAPRPLTPENSLHQALQRWGEAVKGAAPNGAAGLSM